MGAPYAVGGCARDQSTTQYCGEAVAAHRRIAELEAALRDLRLTARVLLQNAYGCAVNHYGVDLQLHGEPGWLRDCRTSIEAAEAALNAQD